MQKQSIGVLLGGLFFILTFFCLLSCKRGVYEKMTGPNEFSLLVYNIAGLPQAISQSDPRQNTPQIASKVNLFDIVLVQEDFFYHYFMRYGDDHPYESVHDYLHGTLGDGLNRFSYCEFFDHDRLPWDACSGLLDHKNDCLTPKGFSVGIHEISEGVFVDIYNLHMDAGSSWEDDEARHVQTDQLIEKLTAFSHGKAVIIAGDFNMNYSNPNENTDLQRLIASALLSDACIELGAGEDRIEKILYRSSDRVVLTPRSYTVEIELFKNEQGGSLSDHDAVSVLFEWDEI
jgi:hypothetical protein